MKRISIAASLAALATFTAAGCSTSDTTETKADACPVVVAKDGASTLYAYSLSSPDDLDRPAQYDDYADRGCVQVTGRYLNSEEQRRVARTTSTWAPANYAAGEDEDVCLRRLSAPAGLAMTERVPCPEQGEGS